MPLPGTFTVKAAESWSLTRLREKLIKVRAKVVSHGRYDVPNGRGRGVMANVLGYPVAHRPAANAARAGVRGAGSDDATGDDGRGAP